MTDQLEPTPATAPEEAVLLCTNAWKRAYDLAFIDAERQNSDREKEQEERQALQEQNGDNPDDDYEEEDDDDEDDIDPERFARQQAAIAFRDAIPPLSGYENTCGFIASVTYAMLHDIFSYPECQNLLAASKVALAALRVQPRPPRSQAQKTRKNSENCPNTSANSAPSEPPLN